jgi:sugar/nucleoside kinase (ribokinase family)
MSTSFEVVTFGETMVLIAPTERDGLEAAATYHASIAGAESNSSSGLARLGHSVSWVSCLGNDPFGNRILKTIRGEGVDTSRAERRDIAPTGLMFKDPGPGNSTRIYYYRRNSAASLLRSEQFDSLAGMHFVPASFPGCLTADRFRKQSHEELPSAHFVFRSSATIKAYQIGRRSKPSSPANKPLVDSAGKARSF